MFRKILVAIENSEISQFVFDEALSLAKATGAQLRVLHVVPPDQETAQDIALYFDLESYPSKLGENAAYAERQFAPYIAEVTGTGVRTEFFQYLGPPGEIICTFAATWGSDLIVMGRREHTGSTELLLGSVSNYVVHHAPCSVFIGHRSVHGSAELSQEQPAQATP